MKQTFDYLENVPNIAATVCDKEGIEQRQAVI